MQSESTVDPKIIEEILKFSKNVIDAPKLVAVVNLFCLDLDLEADTRSIEAAREALRLKLALADKEPDVLSNTDSDEAEIGPEEIDLEQKITFSGLQRVRNCGLSVCLSVCLSVNASFIH